MIPNVPRFGRNTSVYKGFCTKSCFKGSHDALILHKTTVFIRVLSQKGCLGESTGEQRAPGQKSFLTRQEAKGFSAIRKVFYNQKAFPINMANQYIKAFCTFQSKGFLEESFEKLSEEFFDPPGTRRMFPGSRTLAPILTVEPAFWLVKTIMKQAKLRKTGPFLEAKSSKRWFYKQRS